MVSTVAGTDHQSFWSTHGPQHFPGVFLHIVKLHDTHPLQEHSQQSNIYKLGPT